MLRLGIAESIKKLIELGRIKEAEEALRGSIAEAVRYDPEYAERLLIELERLNRLRREYSLDVKEAFRKFRSEFPGAAEDEFRRLLSKGSFDCRIIDGELKFFRNFAFNFAKLHKEWWSRRREDDRLREARSALYARQDEVVQLGGREGGYVAPLKIKVLHKVSLKPGALPPGEKVKVWIPVPRRYELHPSVKILNASHKYYLSGEDHPQRTIYFEGVTNDKGAANFWVEYEYTVYGYYLNVDLSEVVEYDIDDSLYLTYTSKKPPHISFTPYLENLAREIVGSERNPYLKVERIFKWIIKHVTYNLSYDYVLYDNIPEFIAKEKRGDCGMQALLFITLCRIAGIPARWQSGWYMNPLKPGMHDWAQFYIEPYGWLYVDPSFGGSMPLERKHFYLGNIEGFRMAANSDIAVQFDPPKRHFRSDPVDSQRGELEWKYGNLYYDSWDYELKVLSYERL